MKHLAKNGQPMPAWWTPEQRFAVRCYDGKLCCCDNGTRITADLETGAEVPA